MSFYDDIDAALAQSWEVMTRRAFLFDFDGYALRLWEGNGRILAGGEEFHGTMRGDQQFLKIPRLADGRGGESPLYNFELGYLDQATYDAIKADETVVKGRTLTWYRLYFRKGEFGRPMTEPFVVTRLTMTGRSFKESRKRVGDGFVKLLSVGVRARDGNEGQNDAPFAFVNDTDQRAQSLALYGVENDGYARFVPSMTNKTVVVY